jgi:hypothetical protein
MNFGGKAGIPTGRHEADGANEPKFGFHVFISFMSSC